MLIPCPIDIGGKRNRARYDRERERETFEFFLQSFPSSQRGQERTRDGTINRRPRIFALKIVFIMAGKEGKLVRVAG